MPDLATTAALKSLAQAYRESREPTVRVSSDDLRRVLIWAGTCESLARKRGHGQACETIKAMLPDRPGGKRSGMAVCCAGWLEDAMKKIGKMRGDLV